MDDARAYSGDGAGGGSDRVRRCSRHGSQWPRTSRQRDRWEEYRGGACPVRAGALYSAWTGDLPYTPVRGAAVDTRFALRYNPPSLNKGEANMAKRQAPADGPRTGDPEAGGAVGSAVIEFRGVHDGYVYVEDVVGALSPDAVLYANFYSEHVEFDELVDAEIVHEDDKVVLRARQDQKEGNIHIVRDVKANLILTRAALEKVVPWLSAQLEEMKKREAQT